MAAISALRTVYLLSTVHRTFFRLADVEKSRAKTLLD
jgi:hypothetical protein